MATRVHVRVVDVEGAQVAALDLDESALPETFQLKTTLEFGGAAYEVVAAEPPTRAEAAATGAMLLRVRKAAVQQMDPKAMLFGLPTLADPLPDTEAANAREGHVLRLHEDDWRQLELISPAAEAVADAELAAVRQVLANDAAGIGFKRMHVRTGPLVPLEGTALLLSDLAQALGRTSADAEDLAFKGIGGRVAQGFAVRSASGLIAYGRATDGRLLEVGLLRDAPAPLPLGELADWVRAHGLNLVDWCNAKRPAGLIWPRAGEPIAATLLSMKRSVARSAQA